MKKVGIYTLIFAIFSAVVINSCVKKPSYPSTPLIGYNDFVRYGANPSDPDSVVLSITFQDEEGDIGLYQSDTSGIFKKGNFFGILYYDSIPNRNPHIWHLWNLDSTSQTGIPFDTAELKYRIPPVLAQTDKPQPMKGIIYVKMNRGDFKFGSLLHQALYYQIFMYDRAMHKSNVIEKTPVYIF